MTTVRAFLAAVGASFIVSGLVFGVISPLLRWVLDFDLFVNSFFYGPRSIGIADIDGATTVAAMTTAGAVVAAVIARRARSRPALLLYGVLLLLTAAALFVSAVERTIGRASQGCCVVATAFDFPAGVALMFVPAVLVVSIGLARANERSEAQGPSPFLEAAGAYAIAGMIAGVFLLSFRAPLLLAPYELARLDAAPHAVVVVAQTVVAGVIYGVRARAVRPSVFVLFGLLGLAAVAATEIEPIGLSIFAGSRYVPVSLVVVPGLAFLSIGAVWLLRALLPTDATATSP